MRVTIVRDDNTVLVDGERHTVDCSTLPADFHALQWSGFAGEVEYNATRCDHCGVRSKKGNAIISDLAPYQTYVDAWHAAKAEAERVAAAEAEERRLAQEAANAEEIRLAQEAARLAQEAAAAEAARLAQEAATAARTQQEAANAAGPQA